MSDRFDEQAKALRQEMERCGFVLVPAQLVRDCDELIAIELRAEHASALERAVEVARIERDAQASLNAKGQPSWFHRGALVAFDNVLGKLRALIPPAAAPAGETGKVQGADAQVAPKIHVAFCVCGNTECEIPFAAMSKRITDLETALAPFAAMAATYNVGWRDTDECAEIPTMAQVRAAKSALAARAAPPEREGT